MSENKNYVGRKIDNSVALKEAFDSFNHFMPLEAKQVYSVSLRGWFYNNLVNGDNYVISDYGITKFTNHGMDWVVNAEASIEKFIRINKKISEDFIAKENTQERRSNVRDKLGL